MSFLLDTNICVFALKGHAAVLARLEEHHPEEIALSSITLAELWFGARKSKHPAKMRRLQDAFAAPLAVLDFTAEAAERYAEIRLELERRGQPIGERDQMIAAIGLACRRTLVTNNVREFSRVPGLAVVDWSSVAG